MFYFFDGQEARWDSWPDYLKRPVSIPDYGECVFETLRTYRTDHIFAPEDHLDRLFESASIFKIEFHAALGTKDDMRNKLAQGLSEIVSRAKNPNDDLRLNIFLSARYFWIAFQKLVPAEPEIYTSGGEIIDARFERSFPQAKYPNPAYKYFLKSQPNHIFETIFFDRNNFLREGNISNVFAVFGAQVITPKENVLLGVTRSKILELATKYYVVEERNITRKELQAADEIFITNTSKEVVPIRKWGTWENTNFQVAKKLRQAFKSNFVNR